MSNLLKLTKINKYVTIRNKIQNNYNTRKGSSQKNKAVIIGAITFSCTKITRVEDCNEKIS